MKINKEKKEKEKGKGQQKGKGKGKKKEKKKRKEKEKKRKKEKKKEKKKSLACNHTVDVDLHGPRDINDEDKVYLLISGGPASAGVARSASARLRGNDGQAAAQQQHQKQGKQ